MPQRPGPRRGVRADPREQDRADDETRYRAEHGANGVLPGVQRIRAQHRQRAEDHPERVLDPGQPRSEHRQSGLWNVEHVTQPCDPDFLHALEQLIQQHR